MAHYFFAVVTNAPITYYGIEAGIKRIPFGVSTGILACSVF